MFSDIVVLDFTRVVAGPYCSRMLADLGANVIKIDEIPNVKVDEAGSVTREQAATLRTAGGITNNLGKRSLSIDLKAPASKELIRTLLSKTDVVLENFKPGVMDTLGFGPKACLELNPRLIYAGLSGFGQDSSRRAFGATAHAEAGWLWVQQEAANTDEVFAPGVTVADLVTGSNAFSGILAALYSREKDGKGQVVDVSLMDSQLQMMNSVMEPILNGLKEEDYQSFRHPLHRAADGKMISINIGNARNWARISRALTGDESPMPESGPAANAQVSDWVGKLSSSDIADRMDSKGAPYGISLTAFEAAKHPHFAERKMITEQEDLVAGMVSAVDSPIFFSRLESRARGTAPIIGEHSKEILSEFSIPESQITSVIDEGSVFQLPVIQVD